MKTTDVRSTLRSRSTLTLFTALCAGAVALGCGLVGGGDDDKKSTETDLAANGAANTNGDSARGPYGASSGSPAAAPAARPSDDDSTGAIAGAAGGSGLP